jgi:hypothetical protein
MPCWHSPARPGSCPSMTLRARCFTRVTTARPLAARRRPRHRRRRAEPVRPRRPSHDHPAASRREGAARAG